MQKILSILTFLLLFTLISQTLHVFAEQSESQSTLPVTVDNFTRAETDTYYQNYVNQGAFGKFHHIRNPTPIDKQDVIRMNRDTLYSIAVFDLETPVTITNPDAEGRFVSLMIVNQDHYIPVPVVYDSGEFTLTQEEIGTRYVAVIGRIFADANDPQDIKKANEVQDQIKVEQESAGTFEAPNWDPESLAQLRDALNVLAATMTDTSRSFGSKDEVDPVSHLIGTAYGWGGNPAKDASYINVVPEKNDGKTPYTLTVKDVPVDGFWSISLYNGQGFFEENEYGAYSVNNVTADKNDDGSVTIHFGGDPESSNFLPIMDGWNYVVRLYKPGPQILSGEWEFPSPEPVK